jgi:hypothetical protein
LKSELKLTTLYDVLNPPPKPATGWPRPPPGPTLQELVSRYGGYDRIMPEEAWAQHDAAMAKWRLDRADYYRRLLTDKGKPSR